MLRPRDDDPDFDDALGRLVLAVLLLAAVGAGGWCERAGRLEPTAFEGLSLTPIETATLGGPVSCGCSEALAWQALPRVGPVRARSLALAAERGELQVPADLLRIPGIGTKMARAIAARTTWDCLPDRDRVERVR